MWVLLWCSHNYPKNSFFPPSTTIIHATHLSQMNNQKPTESNICRQKMRSAIQVHAKNHPEKKNIEIAKILGTSPTIVSRRKNKGKFTDKKRIRKS